MPIISAGTYKFNDVISYSNSIGSWYGPNEWSRTDYFYFDCLLAPDLHEFTGMIYDSGRLHFIDTYDWDSYEVYSSDSGWGGDVTASGYTIVVFEEQEVSSDLYNFINNNTTKSELPTLSGKWRFKELLDLSDDSWSCRVNFTCNGQQYLAIETQYNQYICYTFYHEEDGNEQNEEVYSFGWMQESYRTIDFGDTAQRVDLVLYSWITENATQQILEAPIISVTGDILTISPVAGATSYNIYANNILISNTTSTSINLTTLTLGMGGTFSIQVGATLNGAESSGLSNAVQYTITLSAPALSLSGDILTITGDERATSYDLYMNGVKKNNYTITTIDLSKFNLTVGNYEFYAIAKADTFNNSSISNIISYTSDIIVITMNLAQGSVTLATNFKLCNNNIKIIPINEEVN